MSAPRRPAIDPAPGRFTGAVSTVIALPTSACPPLEVTAHCQGLRPVFGSMNTADDSGEASARKLCGWNTVSVSTVASGSDRCWRRRSEMRRTRCRYRSRV